MPFVSERGAAGRCDSSDEQAGALLLDCLRFLKFSSKNAFVHYVRRKHTREGRWSVFTSWVQPPRGSLLGVDGGGFPGGVCLSFGGDCAAAAPNPRDTGTLLESTSCWPLLQ